MNLLKNSLFSVSFNRLIGWGCLIIGSYGFILFMLPAVLRLVISIGLLVVGVVCLNMPSLFKRLFNAKSQPPSSNGTP